MPRLPLWSSLLLGLLALVPAACGGTGASSSSARPGAAAQYLPRPEVTRQVANAFRSGLEQVAVMSQAPDEASQLAPSVQPGTLETAHCAAGSRRPAGGAVWRWTCRVRWQDGRGLPRSTRYVVRVTGAGCLSAGATPRLPEVYDATTRNTAVHPLEALAGSGREC